MEPYLLHFMAYIQVLHRFSIGCPAVIFCGGRNADRENGGIGCPIPSAADAKLRSDRPPQRTDQRVCGDDLAARSGRRAAAMRGGHLLLGAGATASLVSGLTTMLLFPAFATVVGAAPRRDPAPGPVPACFAVLPRHPSIMTMPAGMSLARRPSALTSSSRVPRRGSRMMRMQSPKGGGWGVQQWEGLKLNLPGYEGALTRADPMTGEPTGKDIVWSVEIKEDDSGLSVITCRDGQASSPFVTPRNVDQGGDVEILRGIAVCPPDLGEWSGSFCQGSEAMEGKETAFVEQSILMDGGRRRVRVAHSFRVAMAGPCTPDYELVPTLLSLFSEKREGEDFPASGTKQDSQDQGDGSRGGRQQAGLWLNGRWRCSRSLRMSPDGSWREEAANVHDQDEVVDVSESAVATVDLSPVQGHSAVAPVAVRRSVDMRVGGFGGNIFFVETNVRAPDGKRLSLRREISGSGRWLGSAFRTFERVADAK